MGSTGTLDHPSMTCRLFRPLLGSVVVVDTGSGTLRGRLLSCVKDSAWLVVDDTDIVILLAEVVAIHPAGDTPHAPHVSRTAGTANPAGTAPSGAPKPGVDG